MGNKNPSRANSLHSRNTEPRTLTGGHTVTENQAHQRARNRAKREHRDIWIIYEDGEYLTATDYDLETFFRGAEPKAGYNGEGDLIE